MLIVLRLCALALMMLVAYAGTERLGRPLTDDEKKRFSALLREHDYPGARLSRCGSRTSSRAASDGRRS